MGSVWREFLKKNNIETYSNVISCNENFFFGPLPSCIGFPVSLGILQTDTNTQQYDPYKVSQSNPQHSAHYIAATYTRRQYNPFNHCAIHSDKFTTH